RTTNAFLSLHEARVTVRLCVSLRAKSSIFLPRLAGAGSAFVQAGAPRRKVGTPHAASNAKILLLIQETPCSALGEGAGTAPLPECPRAPMARGRSPLTSPKRGVKVSGDGGCRIGRGGDVSPRVTPRPGGTPSPARQPVTVGRVRFPAEK